MPFRRDDYPETGSEQMPWLDRPDALTVIDRRLQAGEDVPLDEFTEGYDQISKPVVECGGLFPFSNALSAGEIDLPGSDTAARPMTVS